MDEIYILRHGHAEKVSNVLSDFDRALTVEGIEKINRLGSFLNTLEVGPDIVLSSPFLRAKQTAEVLVSNLNHKPEIKIVDFLSCGASSKDISKGLLDYSVNKSILIVGHSPDLDVFLGKLIGAGKVNLKKGALAKVNFENNIEISGELEWLITPKIIKRVKVKKIVDVL